MGGQSDKDAPELPGELAAVADTIRRITGKLETNEITFDEATAVLSYVRNFLAGADLKEDVREHLLAKLTHAEQLLYEKVEDEREANEKAEQERIALDALKQLELSKKQAVLVPLYTREYGDFWGKNYVAALLTAGQMYGGYRKPAENPNLDAIQRSVHTEASSGKLDGVSGTGSTSNGLIRRVRDQSAVVVRHAEAAGYNVYHANVQTAMANLGRAIALTLDSDSGQRDISDVEAKFSEVYQSKKPPGVHDISPYTGEASGDPKVLLESHLEALAGLHLRLDRADDAHRKNLISQIERLTGEVERLKKKLSEK